MTTDTITRTASHVTARYGDAEFRRAARLISERLWGPDGRWALDAYDYINATLWAGALPPALIQWALTPYGRCVGQTYAGGSVSGAVITLHTSVQRHRTHAYAFDVLTHEAIHVAVKHVHGHRMRLDGRKCSCGGTSSHDCDAWAAEVNRLAPLIGLPGVRTSRSHGRKRVRDGIDRPDQFPHGCRPDGYYDQPAPVEA